MKKSVRKQPAAKLEVSIDKSQFEGMKCCNSSHKANACTGGVYFLGFLGAAVYYISTATGFWNGVWGVVKALVWPAFLVYKLFLYLAI